MFATPNVKQSGTSLHVEHGNDSNLYVEFTMEAVHQEFESNKQGRPIFQDVPYCRILFAGDRTKVHYQPVREEDKLRFRPQWEAFQRQEVQVASGTPITEWPPLTKSEALEFKALNIHTVEALAALPDTALTWLGARSRREQAKAYLASAKDSSVITKMESELAKRDADIDALKQQIAALCKDSEGEPKKRGRPAKGE